MKENSDSDQSLEARVLQLVFGESYRASKPKRIHKLLGLPEEDYGLLRRTLKRMVQQGKVVYASNHLILRPDRIQVDTSSPARPEKTAKTDKASTSKAKVVLGTFRSTSRGFGFVRLNEPDAEKVSDDVFIPANATLSAMDGDRVQIRLAKSHRGDRTEGIVEEIVERARRQFVGTYQTIENASVVWLDGVDSERPISVGDVRGLPVSVNDKIIVEMVRYPDAFHAGEAVILEVLGASKNPAVDTMAVMHQFGLIEEFPEEVLDQAREMADRFTEEVPSDRTDLTQVPTLTIDPFDARDFDDAISLTTNEAGHWELMVHIADVSHFVPAGTPLDEEAQRRATSVYLPDKVVPMIPEIISNHLASLQPDRVRLAKTVFIEMTAEGTVVHSKIFNSAIRNAQRLNYEQVDQFLADKEPWRERLTPVIFELLSNMHTLAMTLRKRRMDGGSIELTLPEIKIDLDKMGKVKGAHLVHHTESHQTIEELMLAANQAVATYLDDLEIPFLRRAHAPPQRIKLKRLYEFVRGLGIECNDLQDRFEIQRVINAVKGDTTEQAVNYAVLKSMSKAVYQPQVERHYALDMTHYCHFTSPIRRYPDLVVHRIIQKIIDSKNPKESMGILNFLGQHCSDREVNAESAERELIRVKLLHFMSKKVGDEFTGTITAVKADDVMVRLAEIPVDGLIAVEKLPSDRYRFDHETHSLEGFRSGHKYRLGDTLRIRVESVDLARRQLFFTLVAQLSTHHAPSEPTDRISGRNSDQGPRHRDSRGPSSRNTDRPRSQSKNGKSKAPDSSKKRSKKSKPKKRR
jgi:ribonuclease R